MSDESLGRYQLIDRLGAGGMAEVWLADQTGPRGFRRRCVIKRIHSHLNAQEEFVARFEDEARLAAMLRHPNIVRVEDFGEVDGNLFMALEYVDGWEFSDVLRRGVKSQTKIPDQLALEVIIQVSEALDYAHSLKRADGQPLRIVHRDVSPQNILIERGTGTAKLLDFGIASAESNLHETQAGLIKGKIAYFSPEQARGDALDGRTDLYALGLVLHEALTGSRVFRGQSMVQLLRDVTEAQVPSIAEKRSDLPRRLMAAVDRATAPGLNDRFPDGATMAAALREALDELGGAPGRGEMDRWVASLPAPGTLTVTGMTSSVSAPGTPRSEPQHTDLDRTHDDLHDTDEPTQAQQPAPAAEPTVLRSAPVRTTAEETVLHQAEADEATVMADLEQVSKVAASPLRPGPVEMETQRVTTPAKRFPTVMVVTALSVVVALGVTLSLVLQSEPDMPPDVEMIESASPRTQAKPEPPPSVQPEVIKKPEVPQAKPEPASVPIPVEATKPKVAPKPATPKPAAVKPVEVRPKAAPARLPSLSKRDLDAVSMANVQALANCKKGATGIIVNLQIHGSGMPFGIRVTGASPEVARCLRNLVRKWRYPAHGGSAVSHRLKL